MVASLALFIYVYLFSFKFSAHPDELIFYPDECNSRVFRKGGTVHGISVRSGPLDCSGDTVEVIDLPKVIVCALLIFRERPKVPSSHGCMGPM